MTSFVSSLRHTQRRLVAGAVLAVVALVVTRRVGRGAVAAAASTPAAATTDTGVAGGVIAAMRADGSTNAAVSTVDDLERPMGQAATIIALQQQLVGKVGHYGLTKDAQGPIPALTP